MIFPTADFLIFYLIVWLVAWGLVAFRRHFLHKVAIVSASYIFYASWSFILTFLLLGTIFLNWGIAKLLGFPCQPGVRRLGLYVGVTSNLLLLFIFKYCGWFSLELNELLDAFGIQLNIPVINLVLPIGISFFTFQGISYIVDIYKGMLQPRNFIDVAFFISFFPHLVAGPIVRTDKFMPQLDKLPNQRRVLVGMGILLIVWGVFKKTVIANRLAVDLVDKAFINPLNYSAADLIAATYGYAIQIYADFSGYSDIAIGLAALLGYQFQQNFNQPYRSGTVTEFWRRWHITLSHWLRDYVYIPLGGSWQGSSKTYRNLAVTMVLGGLWHGADWKFAIWGALHGGVLGLERWLLGPERKGDGVRGLERVLMIVLTFHFVCFSWIFFRADDLSQAADVLIGFLDWSKPSVLVTPFIMLLLVGGLMMHFISPAMLKRCDLIYQSLPAWAAGVLAGLGLLICNVIAGGYSAPFVYFRF